MKTKYLFGFLSLFAAFPAAAGEWNFDASGSASALYVDRRYEKLNDNNHTPSETEISLSAEYTFDDNAYRAGFYLDAMAGADKELEDYTQGKWGEEAYAILDTPYGRVMGGQTWNVAYQFGVGAPSVGLASITAISSTSLPIRTGGATKREPLSAPSIQLTLILTVPHRKSVISRPNFTRPLSA